MSVRVEELRSLGPAEVGSTLATSTQLPYAAVPGFASAIRAEALTRLGSRALAAGGRAWRLKDDWGEVRGLAFWEPLPHESRHFGLHAVRMRFLDAWGASEFERKEMLDLLLRDVTSAADRDAVDVVWAQYRAVDYAVQHQFGARGFGFADALVDWVARAEALRLLPADDACIVHGAREELAESCGDLAVRGMRFNRFRAEPRFDSDGIDALYRELGSRCARGEIGHHFLSAHGADGTLVGFATLDDAWSDAECAGPKMGAFRFLIRRADAPPGTGAALLDAGCRWLRDRGAEILLAQTVVQNAGMFRRALAIGFRVEDALYDVFRWRPK